MVTRRRFVRFCAAFLASLRAAPAFAGQAAAPFARVRLVDGRSRDLSPSELEVGVNYLFHYPYIATPCFLIRLDRPAAEPTRLVTENGRSYRWQGGVGPERSVVAYSAICAHRMTHPAKSVSFINYRSQPATYLDRGEQSACRAGIIYCCSERSVYDATRGARVLGGPAPQPLAAIRLEYDADGDALFAAGVYGGALFERFFHEFGERLSLEFGTTAIRRPVRGAAKVMRLAEYSRNQILCGSRTCV